MSSSIQSSQVPDPLSESRQGSILKDYFDQVMPVPLSSPVSESGGFFKSRQSLRMAKNKLHELKVHQLLGDLAEEQTPVQRAQPDLSSRLKKDELAIFGDRSPHGYHKQELLARGPSCLIWRASDLLEQQVTLL